MDIQEPEDQRQEDEPMKPAEEVVETSDEPVLNDSAASKQDDVPASVPTSEGESNEASTDEKEVDKPGVVEAEEPEPATTGKEDPPEAASEEKEDDKSAEVAIEEPEPVSTVEEGPSEAASEKKEDDKPTATDAPTEESAAVASSEGNKSATNEAEAADGEPVEAMASIKPDDDPSDWFVIHCYSGYENKVRHNLEQRIETMGMKDMILDVIVPTQEEVEVKDGKRRTVERHIFPGYVLVNLILTEESWYVVRNTPGVTGFVGMGNDPTPLRAEEVSQIVKRMEADAPTIKVTFKIGERVRIIDGPFNDFRGMVSVIDMERTKVRVMVSFFGRETPVECDFLQVEKA